MYPRVRIVHVLISLIAPHASSSTSSWTYIGDDEPRATDNHHIVDSVLDIMRLLTSWIEDQKFDFPLND